MCVCVSVYIYIYTQTHTFVCLIVIHRSINMVNWAGLTEPQLKPT